MKISIPKERRPHERRVAATPDTVKRLVSQGFEVVVEASAGEGAAFPDETYRAAGASIAPDAASALGAGDLVFKVQRPLRAGEGGLDELAAIKRGAVRLACCNRSSTPRT